MKQIVAHQTGDRLIFFILILLLTIRGQGVAQGHPSEAWKTMVDSIDYHPGFYHWDENTVITLKNIAGSYIHDAQRILDHANTNFSSNPESLITIEIGAINADQFLYEIEISPGTIRVLVPSKSEMNTALQVLRQMKLVAIRDSPDYELIYLKCGVYRKKNF